MDRRHSFLSALIFLIIACHIARATETGLEAHREKRGIKGSRQIEVRPETQASGIDSGLVLVYGHIIPPPYKVEYNKRRLMINGVQVKPSLTQARSDRVHPTKPLAPELSDRHKRAGELMRKAQDIYAKEKTLTPNDVLKKKITGVLESDNDAIEKVTWNGWSDVCYKVRGFPVTMCDAIKPDPLRFRNPSAEQTAKGESEMITSIESGLRQGKWVLFGDGGGFSFLDDKHQVVKTIMEDNALSAEEQFKQLADILNDEGCALDVIDNYSSREWSLKRDKK
jgi:hypothetical protein